MARNRKNSSNKQSQNRRPSRNTEETPGFGNKKLEGPDKPST